MAATLETSATLVGFDEPLTVTRPYNTLRYGEAYYGRDGRPYPLTLSSSAPAAVSAAAAVSTFSLTGQTLFGLGWGMSGWGDATWGGSDKTAEAFGSSPSLSVFSSSPTMAVAE